MDINEADYITPVEIHKITGICECNVRKLIKNDAFPSVFIDKKYHIPRTAFLTWWRSPDAIIAAKRAMREKVND